MNRKCFRKATSTSDLHEAVPFHLALLTVCTESGRSAREEQRSPPPFASTFASALPFSPNLICCVTLSKSLPPPPHPTGPSFPICKMNLSSPTLSAAIQNSLVGGPILQNVLGTVTAVNQGLLGSGGLLGGGGLLSYGGVFGVVEELSG